MCKRIEEKIKDILTSPSSGLKCVNKIWNENNHEEIGDIKVRKNITADNYKYMEYTEWDKKQKTCVAIGFNPATIDVTIFDNTNQKIIEALKGNYGSYVLLNLYPQTSVNKKAWEKDDEEDEKFRPILYKILRQVIKDKIDVLIFWGRTVAIDNDLYRELQELMGEELLYMTVKQNTGEHYHPAYVPIEIKKVTQSSFIGVNALK